MPSPCPSRTALRVALQRAAHQVLDQPPVFVDPLALDLLGLTPTAGDQAYPGWLDDTPIARVFRASMAARSRFAEDCFAAARQRGVRQFVLLGAGLDTFAARLGPQATDLQVFEVDHPAMQAWKRQRLQEAGLPMPPGHRFVAVDFERHSLGEGLLAAGFVRTQPAWFSWLGVTMYLSAPALNATWSLVAGLPAGSGILFDYMLPPELHPPRAAAFFQGLAQRVAAAGEPFCSFFKPSELRAHLLALGFTRVEDLSPMAMDARYFHGRTDGLRVGSLTHVAAAEV